MSKKRNDAAYHAARRAILNGDIDYMTGIVESGREDLLSPTIRAVRSLNNDEGYSELGYRYLTRLLHEMGLAIDHRVRMLSRGHRK